MDHRFILRIAAAVFASAVLIISLFHIIRYAVEYAETIAGQKAMSAAYHDTAEPTAAPMSSAAAAAEDTEIVEIPVATVSARQTAAPEASGDTLPRVVYPDNPHGIFHADSGLLSMWNVNQDIRGWLEVEELVDTAVVLRDNRYYLTHGADGKQNSNGALFLDAQTVFYQQYRPYTLIVYGHNMRSGAMFGSLKKYLKQSWYAAHPFITFNTLYEQGRYVVFFVNKVNVSDPAASDYLYIYQLYENSASARSKLLQTMKNRSHCSNRISVSGDDQILLLVTCNGNDDERLVVAARRIRDGETEEELLKLIR